MRGDSRLTVGGALRKRWAHRKIRKGQITDVAAGQDPAQLGSHFLGPFRVTYDDRSVIGFASEEGRAVLAYLLIGCCWRIPAVYLTGPGKAAGARIPNAPTTSHLMLLAHWESACASAANGNRRVAACGLSFHQAIRRTTFIPTAVRICCSVASATCLCNGARAPPHAPP
jgi:hypothetical protein